MSDQYCSSLAHEWPRPLGETGWRRSLGRTLCRRKKSEDRTLGQTAQRPPAAVNAGRYVSKYTTKQRFLEIGGHVAVDSGSGSTDLQTARLGEVGFRDALANGERHSIAQGDRAMA